MVAVQPNLAQVNEDRTKVTHYAFEVSEALLNTPLASPSRRAFAILIDVCVVSLLAKSFGFLVFIAASLLLLKWRKQQRGWGKRIITVLWLVSLAYFIAGAVSHLQLRYEGAKAWKPFVSELASGMQEAFHCENEACEAAVEQKLEQNLTRYAKNAATLQANGQAKPRGSESETAPISLDINIDTAHSARENGAEEELDVQSSNNDKPFTFISAIKTLLQDLGITFGFAALYFSLCPAVMHGQTLGKKILGIRVVLLDGSTPNIWEAFVRYGGYTAGLATGLLGFLQIFWDANRQAIQDKISETLVIRETVVIRENKVKVNEINVAE